MNNKVMDAVEYVTIASGLAISIDQIKTILGIVLLVVQILLISAKVIQKVIQYHKNKEYTKIESTLKDGYEDLKKIKEQVDKDSKEDGKQ